MAFAVEEDEAAGGVGAMGEFAHAGVGDCLRERLRAALLAVRDKHALVVQKIRGHLGHHDFHDAFAVARAGDAPGFCIGVAAAADERRISDAPGKLAASAARGSSGDQVAVRIEGDGADRPGLVADVMLRGMGILEAAAPGGALTVEDQIFGFAQRDAVFGGEFFRAGPH